MHTMNDTLPASTTRLHRTEILRYAKRLTIHADIPEAVTAHARALHAWMDAATDLEDRRDRFTALQHADSNRPDDRTPDDDPHRLISEAEAYYAFLHPGTGLDPAHAQVSWHHDEDGHGLTWHSTSLNGWGATIWDYGSHPDNPPHPEGQPFRWGVRPTMTFADYDREGHATDLETAKGIAEQNLRELAVEPATQDEDLATALAQILPAPTAGDEGR
ncbi:hypothetical protein GCM10023191_101650 [Actinoallomurus oryzae]|uniref:Uncharacterized protein n=1 Tax=Actinoallomurus oryzae TaxID=502180 RepID=A0ABP8R9C7_9ACTN